MSKAHYYCINCMHPTTSLYQKFSSEVIRLKECDKCGEVVDKYVEYDTVLIVIDLIIHYSTAYKHFLYNMKHENFIRMAVIFWLCDAYDKWIWERAVVLDANKVYDLELIFYKSLIQSLVEIMIFIFIIIVFERITQKTVRKPAFLAKSTLIGYYGNVAVVLSIIFRLSNDFSYRMATLIFLFISHIQVQRALFPSVNFMTNFFIIVFATISSMQMGYAAKSFLNYIDSTSQ